MNVRRIMENVARSVAAVVVLIVLVATVVAILLSAITLVLVMAAGFGLVFLAKRCTPWSAQAAKYVWENFEQGGHASLLQIGVVVQPQIAKMLLPTVPKRLELQDDQVVSVANLVAQRIELDLVPRIVASVESQLERTVRPESAPTVSINQDPRAIACEIRRMGGIKQDLELQALQMRNPQLYSLVKMHLDQPAGKSAAEADADALNIGGRA